MSEATNVVTNETTGGTTAPVTPVNVVPGGSTAPKSARQYAAELIEAESGPQPTVDLKATHVVPETDWSIDEFMKQDFSDDPIMGTSHKDLPPFKEIVARHVTPEGKKLIANLRSDYSRKTQELAAMKRDLQIERATLAAERASLLTGPTAEARRRDASIDTSTLDPYIEADMQTMLRVQAAQLVEEQLKPMRQSMEQRAQEQAAQAFVNAHPELNEPAYKTAMVEILKSKPHLDVETAFELAKAKVMVAHQEATKTERKTTKAAGRDYLDAPKGNQVTTSSTRPMSAREKFMELSKASR